MVWLPTAPPQAIHVGSIKATEGGRDLARFFGEAGLIASSKNAAQLPIRTASIVADEPSLLLMLQAQNYQAFTRLLPGVEAHFARVKVRQRAPTRRWTVRTCAPRVASNVRVAHYPPASCRLQAVQEGLNETKRATAQTVAMFFSQDGGVDAAPSHGFGKYKKYEQLQQLRKKQAEQERTMAAGRAWRAYARCKW